jgi:CubicO group peptidase (beta-lactamase class C family)
MHRRLALLPLIALSLGCASSNVAERLDRVVGEAVAGPIADRRFLGVVVVARDGRPIFRKAYGLADREQGIAHTPDTPFMIMSVSKQFTAALILRLVAAGKLRLEDPVSKYLADWPAEWNGVEVRHLLSHSSGLHIDTTYFWLVKHHPEYWADGGSPPPYEPRPLVSLPGTTYGYANVGYTLLTMVAAKAGGAPFDDLLRAEVLRPLGLTHTLPERNRHRVTGRARGYTRTETGFELKEQGTVDIIGAGDLVSTAEDLVRFDTRIDDDRFLPAALRREMLTPRVAGPRGSSLGYGWFLRTNDAGRLLQFHSGSGEGFRAFNYRLPKEHLAVVVLCNVDEAEVPWVRPLVDRIAEVVSPAPVPRSPSKAP